ncbi:zinc finger and BTB domain-containing protein 22 [Corythoichthys intestinalis]|uniref:zinc finger and BTB domain-containing protein 22 n=1 Tax=Corythoichthys intestinalis TaxID=161448 RepID=UPI0025A5FEF7|nr:zinc finger and BTB domain-containing protein 22 [Corythoichthys intestinalis]XP_057683453.1 zinc finger and BTB domain-containing protein 22 [Corythoichthys intestinalis]XP_057683454.1 zinc finger and BTB domain-containing protein 22 [Corythoichthys intestinalis]XP_057683455.1 zinc finger and BTB domain-containing protein 22 [Corythoichthys intestinalis]XP_061808663.1 zinc finger and BTB domain-containing protein 22-like [Nerophis lumbriciformis]
MDPSSSASSVPPALTVQVCFPSVRAAVLDNLNHQREEGRLCDLSIHVQGKVFKAHRCVLAASSPYFHDQVLLKNVTTVSLPSVMDPVAFESVLSSAYTGQLSIVHDDIVNYVTVASFLQMWHIVDKCTEILKRPRPAADASLPDASAVQARQQSPSSTDCLYIEREGRRKDVKPDALPPLATWRRPQQFSRWGSSRPTLAQHSADSQVDCLPYTEADDASCEDASHSKSGLFIQGGPSSETFKLKSRCPTRAALHEKNFSREGSETQQRKKERRELEADEGVGEEVVEKKEGFAHTGDSRPVLVENEDSRRAMLKVSLADVRDKGQMSSVPPSHKAESHLGEPCVVLARAQWQASAWSQQESRSEVVAKPETALQCLNSETYDEIEDGTGQVSQRPLVPTSPDFNMAASESGWLSPTMAAGTSSLTVSARHLPPSSANPPPPSSPPTPSSSSHVTAAGAPYAGKVHFCHCGKAFTLKSMRDRHVKMQHLNLRPFACPVCNKSFKMKHHLTKHLKTHGGLRPHECGVCGKKIIWRDSFLRHQARCERLASSANPQTDADDGYAYNFDGGDAFLSMGGQVKVEEVDFQGEMEDGMSGLLGSVSGMVEELRTQHLEASAHVYKEEVGDNFSESK